MVVVAAELLGQIELVADLLDDPRIATREGRIANSDSLYRDVAAILATRTTAEWLAFCTEPRCHFPKNPVRYPAPRITSPIVTSFRGSGTRPAQTVP